MFVLALGVFPLRNPQDLKIKIFHQVAKIFSHCFWCNLVPTMGHLSTSERVDAAKVICNNGQVTQVIFSDKNGKLKLDNSVDGKIDMDVNNNDVKAGSLTACISENGKVGKTELNDPPVSTFIGPKILGVQFLAPLKWDKIIMISLLHFTFLYGGLQYSFRKRILGTLWCK